MERKIIHVDMDAFYAAIEQRDNPDLKGKPVIIGGKENTRGVVSTASYEARKYGIHSAMPLVEAYRRCPEAVFIKPDLQKYRRVSYSIMRIFEEYTPLVEPLSLDEAFLDVTGSQKLFGSAEEIGIKIKDRIKKELNLTASIGIAPNKFLAKLSSDLNKPDGFNVVNIGDLKEKIWPLPITKLWGIGNKTANKLKGFNINTIGELARVDESLLVKLLGSWGQEVKRLANGIDPRPVVPERDAHSIGHEITFKEDIKDKKILEDILLELSQDVGWRLRRTGFFGKTIIVKLRFYDFQTITRSQTISEATNRDDVIFKIAQELFHKNFSGEKSLRLIGITLSNLVKEEEVKKQLTLFNKDNYKFEKLYSALDKINLKYGKETVTRARLIKK